MKTKKTLALILAVMLLITLAACGTKTGAPTTGTPATKAPATGTKAPNASGAVDPSSYSGTVVLYSSTDEDVIVGLKKAFEAKYPRVKLDYYAATSGKCVTKLATEFQSGTVACDVAWLADPSAMITLKGEGNLVAYKSPYAARVDNIFKDTDGYYCGARLLLMGITFSTTTCSDKDAPSNYDGVINDAFKKQIVLTDPTGSGSTKALIYALTNNQKYGWKYIENLKALGAEMKSSSGDTNNAVASGAYKIAFGVDYTTKNLMAGGSPLGWHDTKDVVAVPCPIGIPKGAPHMELAKLLYDFILDPNGGQALLPKYNITPISSDAVIPKGFMKASDIAKVALPIDWNDLAKVSNSLLDRFNSIFQK